MFILLNNWYKLKLGMAVYGKTYIYTDFILT